MAQITTYTVDAAKRRILTVKNMAELEITDELILGFLKDKKITDSMKYRVDEKGNYVRNSKGELISLWPSGVSINDKNFGNFTDSNAAQRGWMSFFEIGAPLFEERSNIIPPIADIISTRTYENRSNEIRQFSDTIEFTVENIINWSLSSAGSSSFRGEVSSEVQGELSKTLETILTESLANSLAKANSNTITKTHHDHNHKDDIGTEDISSIENQLAITATTEFNSTNSNGVSLTGTGTATGSGDLYEELELSLIGKISGTITTSWLSKSNVSGNISANSRVETIATQRRQIKQFTYEIPITFEGYIALSYDELVSPPQDGEGPLAPSNFRPAKVIPAKISVLNLLGTNKLYKPKGIAETVSALDVNHTIFDTKPIYRDGNQRFGTNRPHNL